MPTRQTFRSEHERAERVIVALREAAQEVKALGDEVIALETATATYRDAIYDLEAEKGDLEEEVKAPRSWEDDLNAFRLEIIDRDELLARTIGLRGQGS